MRRTAAVTVVFGVCALAACSPGSDVTETTSAPVETDAAAESSSSGSAGEASSQSSSEPDPSEQSGATDSGEEQFVALPGLLDPSDEALAVDDEVRTGTLENGLQYYVRHNDRPGAKAELRLAIKAGSVNETGPHTGVAHFVEHMLFNGTEQYPKNELIDALRQFGAAFGADINAYTSFDETVYELNVPNDDESLDTGMTILQEWLSHATFDPDQVESERGVVTDEWRQSTQSVEGRLSDIAESMYLGGSAYEGRDPIGTQDSIASVPRDELYQFYTDWYRPDNAAVVVVGDIDVDEFVDEIEQRFGSATVNESAMPERPDTAFALETEPAFALHSDPDQTTVDVEVDLPIPMIEGTGTAAMRARLLDQMIFDTLIRRLDQDISTGAATFDEILPGSNSFVGSLDAPALYAITDADRVDDTLTALLEEYERSARFGFSAEETELARASAQAQFDSAFNSSDTTQDVEFAQAYVANFLTGAPYTSADDMYETASDMIEMITPEALDLRFRARWSNTAPHVIISSPAALAADMPSEADVLAAIEALATTPLEPREASRQLPDTLMAAPDPVAPLDQESISEYPDDYFDPVEITFPNGARVIFTSNDISQGQVGFQATSLGGSSLIADDDVPDALYAADIVTSSGVGEFNQTELETILADRAVELSAWLTPYTENLAGGASSTDLETLFQLINLYMTQPRVDPVAWTQLQRLHQPLVDDPGSDPAYAGYDALLDARYPGELRYAVIPTPEQFAEVDLEGAERVWRDRYGDAGDWVFSFAGDFDRDELIDLASRYIGSLPGDATQEQVVNVTPPPPTSVVKSVVQAGTGDTATLSMLFTTYVDDVDGALRANTDVVAEVLTTRLTDVIRERLGESYSPDASVMINEDPTSVIETLVSVTGDPARIEAVGDLVIAEFADLAANGPTDREFDGAYAQVEEAYGFVDNGSFIEEMLNQALYPERGLDDYYDEFAALSDVTPESVRQYIAAHMPADAYISVAVEPR